MVHLTIAHLRLNALSYEREIRVNVYETQRRLKVQRHIHLHLFKNEEINSRGFKEVQL